MLVRHTPTPPRDVMTSMLRGLRRKCPNCGTGNLFAGFLKVSHSCTHCGEDLHHHRADDAPPYFTILIVGHIVVPFVLLVETLYRPDFWLQAAFWLPLTVGLTLLALPPIKGCLVALQWALYMHGFDPNEKDGPISPHGV